MFPVVLTAVGVVLVAIGTVTAAPELRAPTRRALRKLRGSISAAADGIRRSIRQKLAGEKAGTAILAPFIPSATKVFEPGVFPLPNLDVDERAWRTQTRDSLLDLQRRVHDLSQGAGQDRDKLKRVRQELLDHIAAELEAADARHIRSRFVGALLVLAGTTLLALAPFVGG